MPTNNTWVTSRAFQSVSLGSSMLFIGILALPKVLCLRHGHCTLRIQESSNLKMSPKMADASPPPPPDSCLVPYDAGPCRASFPMFYFDFVTHTCRPFNYGGCRGNSNRYNSAAVCLARCSGGQGRSRSQRAPLPLNSPLRSVCDSWRRYDRTLWKLTDH